MVRAKQVARKSTTGGKAIKTSAFVISRKRLDFETGAAEGSFMKPQR
jgi:hypothetical protein